ncbi:hypothetical protein GGI19_001830 [Coemansia pectinata]|uniref:MPN domain-containing protein n=1 Tax=Coemansia pectinata TaxID=1052879 RepID=A0A9W8LCU7_9FUNG|nr:hypothetical protein GGI19_001830 [Coemansia pectinata]
MDAETLPLFELDFATVCDVERQACREFFAGKANKTPERYMMIRNYMVEAWHAAQPLYLTKIKARAGLRNCGDVNAIGRIHTFLEHARIINVGAERSSRRSQPAKSTRRRVQSARDSDDEAPDDDDDDEAWNVPRGVAAMTGRRRRVRDEGGNWVYEDEYYGGHVISHDVIERHADDADYSCSDGSDNDDGPARKRRRNHKQNGMRYQVHSEFRLVPCRSFDAEEAPRPFTVEISAAALALMDLHSHLMYTEVIGLLGGAYDAAAGVVRVDVAFPCNSTSTTTECEMDPASEVDARRVFALQGRHVVGWFHSHPTFDAMPSVRDIHNQHAYQALCRRASDSVEPFVGVIVSPPGANTCAYGVSDISVFYVVPDEHGSPDGVPYQLPYAVVSRDEVPADAVDAMAQLVERHAGMEHRVDLARRFRRSEAMTALEKLVISLRSHWDDGVLQQWDDAVSLRLRPLLQRHYCRSGSGSGSHSEPIAAPTAHDSGSGSE